MPIGQPTIPALREQARANLDAGVWNYLEDGNSLPNTEALAGYPLTPRPLQDLREGHTRLRLFGQTLEHPLLLAPVAYQRLFHVQGECASAMAAAAQGGQMLVSSLASQEMGDIALAYTTTLHEIAATTPQTLPTTGGVPVAGPWFQLYWQADRPRTLRLLQRAVNAGCSAVVFTVDAPIKPASLKLPDHIRAVNLEPAPRPDDGPGQVFGGWMAQAPTWDDLAWLRRQTTLPLLVKGLMHPDDAQAALDAGCDGIVVSNHGGRVLAGTTTSLQALNAIAHSLRGQLPLLFDSGVRSGRDAFVALANGATAVLVGRPYLWGLAAGGALGVAQVLRILRDELEMMMALTGCKTLQDITLHCQGATLA